jgi:hypothetical protein
MGGTLGDDYESGKAGAVAADGRADTDLGLDEAVGTALAVAVEEEDNGPFLVGGPVVRHKDLILIGDAANGERTVQEAGFGFAGQSGRAKG